MKVVSLWYAIPSWSVTAELILRMKKPQTHTDSRSVHVFKFPTQWMDAVQLCREKAKCAQVPSWVPEVEPPQVTTWWHIPRICHNVLWWDYPLRVNISKFFRQPSSHRGRRSLLACLAEVTSSLRSSMTLSAYYSLGFLVLLLFGHIAFFQCGASHITPANTYYSLMFHRFFF